MFKVHILLVLCFFGGGLALRADEYATPLADKHSDVTCQPLGNQGTNEVYSVVDTLFASTLHTAIGDNQFQSLIITFAECYGGGMIDDVAAAYAASTKPISMTSGSRWDELSNTQKSTPGAATNNGYSRWSQVYYLVHPGIDGKGANKNPKESDAYNYAKTNAIWSKANPKRTSQLKTLNNGGNLILGAGTGGSGATKYRALLFVGRPNSRPDYWNDIVRQYKMLLAAGYPATNIVVLYGDGTAPAKNVEPTNAIPAIDGNATRTNLLQKLSDLSSVDANTQVYIYIGDHGSRDKVGDVQTKLITPDATQVAANTFYFDPLSADEQAALSLPENTSGPYLQMTVAPTGSFFVPTNYTVFLNGHPVSGGNNSFVSRSTIVAEYEFPVSVGDLNLSGTNEVWFQNNFSSDPDVNVELYLSMGDFATYLEDYIPVLNISRTGTMTTITFAAQAGITNTLQGTYSLKPEAWTTIQTVVGADSTVTITDTDAAATKFYQVILGPVGVPTAAKPNEVK